MPHKTALHRDEQVKGQLIQFVIPLSSLLLYIHVNTHTHTHTHTHTQWDPLNPPSTPALSLRTVPMTPERERERERERGKSKGQREG